MADFTASKVTSLPSIGLEDHVYFVSNAAGKFSVFVTDSAGVSREMDFSRDFGTFSGNTLTDNSDIKALLQELEIAVELSGTGSSEENFTTVLKGKLDLLPANAENNVNADYTESDTSADSYIRNKPSLSQEDFTPTLLSKLNGIANAAEVNVQSDWTETRVNHDSYINNKPISGAVSEQNFTTVLKNKLDSVDTGSEVNVQSDWTESNTSVDSYIDNKPLIPITEENFTSLLKTKLDGLSNSGQFDGVAVLGNNSVLGLTHLGKLIEIQDGTVSIHLDSVVNFPIGTKFDCVRIGAGVASFSVISGVTLRSASNARSITTRYGGASVVKIAANEWLLVGDIS